MMLQLYRVYLVGKLPLIVTVWTLSIACAALTSSYLLEDIQCKPVGKEVLKKENGVTLIQAPADSVDPVSEGLLAPFE